MKTRFSIFWFCFGILTCAAANAQLNPSQCPYTGHSRDLICLIPEVTQTGPTSLQSFNTTIAQVLGQLPLAVPNSAFILGFDKNGIPVDLTQNLGSVLTERGNTIGKYKLFLGFTYQRFVFSTVDGNKLSNLPFFSENTSTGIANYSVDRLSANINQYTAFAAFGLTSRVDVSLSLPFQRVSVSGARSNVQTWSGSTFFGTQPSQYAPGSASGPGDLLLNIKTSVLPGEGKSRLALGLETRFPTGNEYNLLGTGAYGLKPYFVFSRLTGIFTPHVNVGFQWNGFSVLRISPTGGYMRLPDTLDYSAGVDVGLIRRRLSMVADFVGQRYFNAPRVLAPSPLPATSACMSATPSCAGLTTVGVANSDYNVDNIALGLKLSPAKNVVVSANAMIRLDTGGLRPERFVPLVGISYLFGK